MSRPVPRRGGRRPGRPDTRAQILETARELFAERGFAATSVRSIAAAAAVDAAMVHHYFGTKRELFLAAVQAPADPAVVLPIVLDGDPALVGERLVGLLLQVWDPGNGGGPLALLRTAFTDTTFVPLLRELLRTQLLAPLLAHVGVPEDERERRGALVASQLVGVAVTRFVLGFPGVGEQHTATVVTAAGATVQRYLTGPLPDPSG